ncbi:hypothetical protein [Enterococcus wangshanyuanii]|uniref:Bacteriocin n=1 Tax=Enterococcus wangshanyuanii TaxID=2005703 RepID=A0ABQ1PVV7_9ENTE|nr:hypothetical protein [Enterococcus wangshanyuanii]GGD05433.1 hypothetical protein GCM10011573_38610 [Enterococcus wangshanyuanii]
MDKFKELNSAELAKVNAGSNDGFWFGVGYVAGTWWKANAAYNNALKQARGY